MTDIKSGDVVTYRRPAEKDMPYMNMGISGCTVVSVVRGKAEGRAEEDWAELEWWPNFNGGKTERFHSPVAWIKKEVAPASAGAFSSSDTVSTR
jgi:hypothetical protein